MAGSFEVEVRVTDKDSTTASGHLEYDSIKAATPAEAAAEVKSVMEHAATQGKGSFKLVSSED